MSQTQPGKEWNREGLLGTSPGLWFLLPLKKTSPNPEASMKRVGNCFRPVFRCFGAPDVFAGCLLPNNFAE
eukprot:5213635-Pyramimonas_sp.AAC.1